MRNFLNNKPLAQGVVSNFIFQFLWLGALSVISSLATLSAYAKGLPLYAVILVCIGASLALALLLNLVSLLYVRHRKNGQSEQLAEAVNATPIAEVARLTERIKELENCEATAARNIERCGKEKAKADERAETLNLRVSSYEATIKQYKRLHAMADEQAKDVARHAQVEGIIVCYTGDWPYPYIVFAVDIDNRSVFDVLIDNEITGRIKIAGEPLLEKIQIDNQPVRVSALRKGSITLKQRLSKQEYDFIMRCRERDEAVFYFDDLIITCGNVEQGVANSPLVLNLPNRPPIRYEPAKE